MLFRSNAAKEKLINHLGRGFYYKTREWPYKNVTPRILAEKYLVDESGIDLKDYKFFCFDGQVKFIQVDFDRFTNHKRNFYNTSWEFQDLEVKYPNNKNYIIDKPKMLKTMIQMASELSRDIPHLRVDFYSIKDTFFFGELTFFHGNGTEEFYPSVWNSVFGSFIKLTPKI